MTAILKVRDKQTGEFISIPAIKGDTGKTPNIALSVTMLEENAEPTVDKSGTAENPSIVIGIPSGHIFTFEDFNPEQVELLQQPAIDAAATANSAASNANTKASVANEKAILADQKATAANEAKDAANTAAEEAAEATQEAISAANQALSIVDRNDKMLPLGSIAWMLVKTIPDGYEPLTSGHIITRAQYPDFFAQLVDTNNLLWVTQSIYTSQLDVYGSCPSFVKIDANTIRLPKLATYMRAGDNLGGVLNDQIMDISGNILSGCFDVATGDGAFATSSGQAYGQGSGPAGKRNISFKASRVVRTGDEVRPRSFTARPFLKCADVSRTLTEEQTSEIRNLYVNKANTDLGNVSLIKDLITSNAYYYKAPDGLMFQWGYRAGQSGGTHTVNFPISFHNEAHIVLCSMLPSTDAAAVTGAVAKYKYASYFIADARFVTPTNSGGGSEGFYWMAIGRWK